MRATTGPPVALITAVLLAATGCGHHAEPASGCLPARLSVTPAEVEAGGEVTLSAPAAGCDLGYDEGPRYEVGLTGEAGAGFDLGEVEVAEDGSFRTVLTVPADAPPGPSTLAVSGSRYDECLDTTGSCAGYGVYLTVVPAG